MGWKNSSFSVYVKSRMLGTITRASSILSCAIKSASLLPVPCSVGVVFGWSSWCALIWEYDVWL